jgi:putative endonuclease
MTAGTAQPEEDGRRTLGRYGEELAARYLAEQGLLVVDRNWRCAHGEIDLVARDGDCLVFCEVKTRRTERFGGAVEAVDRRKVATLRRLVAAWLQSHDERAVRVRIDVIGILRPHRGPAQLRHLVGVGS